MVLPVLRCLRGFFFHALPHLRLSLRVPPDLLLPLATYSTFPMTEPLPAATSTACRTPAMNNVGI
jgi:hypothetical protein